MSRVDIEKCQPEAYAAMFGLERYLAASTIAPTLRELVRVRASLINGCQYCIAMHTDSAKALGVEDEKIAALADWRRSDLFADAEAAALALTDALTTPAARGLPDTIYHAASEFFNEAEMAQLIMLVATINAWNRLGISMATRSESEPARP